MYSLTSVQRHDVEQEQARDLGALQQVRTEGDGSADVVRHHVRSVQRPVAQERRQPPPLGDEIDRVLGAFRGCAVPRHVPQEHAVLLAQCLRHRRPHLRGPGRAVAQHDVARGGPVRRFEHPGGDADGVGRAGVAVRVEALVPEVDEDGRRQLGPGVR
jgi:hypothetical protein